MVISKKCESCHKKKCGCLMSMRSLRKHRFGEYGPGYVGDTSFKQTAMAPYFGKNESFVVPSEWFLPVSNSSTNGTNSPAYQFTEGLSNGFGRRFGSRRFGSKRFGSKRFGSRQFGSRRFGSKRFGSRRF